MTYDLSTTIIGPVDCTISQIVASVLDCPQADGWPARTRYSDAELLEYADAWIRWTGIFGFRTAGQVGRANHETNHLRYTGDVPHGSHNFAGLGATGGVTGRGYESIDAGVLAVCAHQGCYTWGDVANWPEHLRQYHNASGRYQDVMRSGHAGTVKQWGDFTNGRWAWTQSIPVGSLANGYARSSVAKANRVLAQLGGTSPTLAPPPDWQPPEIVRRLLPRNASNTPQRRMDWQWITVHNTGNPNPTADALMHASWLESLVRAGASEPSWQYTVDDTRVVQHLEDDQAGWHASDGNGPGNLASLGFELVEIGNQERVLWNAGWVIAQKLRSKNKGLDAVRQHHDWARDQKNCPRLLRANGGAGWKRLLAIVNHFLTDAQPGPPPAPAEEISFAEVPHTISGGFRGQWQLLDGARHHGTAVGMSWLMLGLPRSPEFEVQLDGERRVAQVFDRGALCWAPSQPRPWDIQAPLSRHWVEIVRQGVAAGVLDLEPMGLALTSAGNVTTRSTAA
jgi:N-acetylmuramoyl-L-alanine amidase